MPFLNHPQRPMDAAALLAADVRTLRKRLPHSQVRILRELLLAEAWVATGRQQDAEALLPQATADVRRYLGNDVGGAALLPFLRVQAQQKLAAGAPAEALQVAAAPTAALQAHGMEPIRIEIERAHALRRL